MDPPPTATTTFPATESKDESAAGRSRVYIACTLCRQGKIKCGGEQPACRNCTRIELACHYDREPKRRGPDKKPGTRTRTRKNSDGTALPPKSRLTRPPQTVPSSGELVLVPSQPGPLRTKKRTRALRGPLPDQTSRAHHPNDQAVHSSNEGDHPSTITPPSLPGELGSIVSKNPLDHGQARHPPPELSGKGSSGLPGHQLPPVQLPQLPVRSSRAHHDSTEPSISPTDRNGYTESPVVQASSNVHPQNIFNDQTNPIWPEEQLVQPHTYRSSIPHSGAPDLQGSQPRPSHAAQPLNDLFSSYPPSIPNPGIDLQHGASTDTASAPLTMPDLPPTSPVFTRLQHTYDPHFRPPKDPFAGLAYPRAGMAIPALGRSSRSPGFGTSARNSLDVVDGTSHNPTNHLELQGTIGQEVQPYVTEGYSSGSYESYGHSPATLSVEGLPYRTPSGSTYDNYSTPSHDVQHGGNFALAPDMSYSTQPGYLSSGGLAPLNSADLYDPRTGGYSTAHTPAEITILPPPVGGLGLWGEQSSSSSEYAESASGTGYISEVYDGASDAGIRSTIYDESTASEAEDPRQIASTSFTYGRTQDQFARPQRMFYNGAGSTVSWISEPSSVFTRQTWWDGLLEMYAPTKTEAAKQITSDLKYLFKTTNYWMSFFNIGLFMTNYNHRERRDNIQPSLMLAALAYSTFTQSSEIERAQEGRSKAMLLRNHAQSALEASLNSRRLDPTLAQAAWLLALFEVSAHPEHSTVRSRSALTFLDSIIRLLGLTTLDIMDPQASVFTRDDVPRLPLSPKYAGPNAGGQFPLTAQGSSMAPATCACHALSIACTTTHSQLTPFWTSSPGWDPSWTEAEIRREESRRLVWSALTLAAGFTAHDAAFAKDPTELHIIDASNYALCFPGEIMLRGHPNPVHSPHESVWALYGRAMLLWNSCLILRKSALRMTEAQRAEFAVNVWLETNTIEEALNRHTCAFERNSLFQGREYLFNTRMFISWEFRRYIPSPDTEVHQQFHRRKAEEWLRHQAEVAKRLMQGLHTITGVAGNVLGKRPYFVWWFMSQVSRCLSLWQCDQSLFIALEVARAFLPPIDYLTCLWPCEQQRSRYYEIRQRLHNECVKYGLDPPPPPQLVIPTAML